MDSRHSSKNSSLLPLAPLRHNVFPGSTEFFCTSCQTRKERSFFSPQQIHTKNCDALTCSACVSSKEQCLRCHRFVDVLRNTSICEACSDLSTEPSLLFCGNCEQDLSRGSFSDHQLHKKDKICTYCTPAVMEDAAAESNLYRKIQKRNDGFFTDPLSHTPSFFLCRVKAAKKHDRAGIVRDFKTRTPAIRKEELRFKMQRTLLRWRKQRDNMKRIYDLAELKFNPQKKHYISHEVVCGCCLRIADRHEFIRSPAKWDTLSTFLIVNNMAEPFLYRAAHDLFPEKVLSGIRRWGWGWGVKRNQTVVEQVLRTYNGFVVHAYTSALLCVRTRASPPAFDYLPQNDAL